MPSLVMHCARAKHGVIMPGQSCLHPQDTPVEPSSRLTTRIPKMFQNVHGCTLNSCTMNEISGNQENHFTTTNDSRSNCNNQRTVNTTNSHNVLPEEGFLKVPQTDDLHEGLPPSNQNDQALAHYERDRVLDDNLDDFDEVNRGLGDGDSALLPAPDNATDIVYPAWHANGESIPIPIHDRIEEPQRVSTWQAIRNTLHSRSSGKSSPSVNRFGLNAKGE
ncbi:hypothetical protein AB1N83_009208 [Pleurotus pulmonarius]